MFPVDSKIVRPKSSFQNYKKVADEAIANFATGNQVFAALETGRFNMTHWHHLLIRIFHQVYHSSTSFAMAGAMLSQVSESARTYLIHHAEEEKEHWKWILDDLKSTGYSGPDPRATFPHASTQSYFSYGIYLSLFNPLGRLAMANVLEGISGKYGGPMGGKAAKVLNLKKEQASFFLNHGELDVGHTHDIQGILSEENVSPEKWAELENVAQTTSTLYKALYAVE